MRALQYSTAPEVGTPAGWRPSMGSCYILTSRRSVRGDAVKLIIARVASVFIVASMLLGVGVISAQAAPQDDVLSLTNAQRSSAGIAPLTRDTSLDTAAQLWANEMSRTQVFVHSGNDWRAARIPAGWTTHGENIAYGYTTASAVMTGWMNSAGHRANILRSSFTHIGVGYVASGNYWVQIFAGYSAASSPTRPPFGSLDDVKPVVSEASAEIRLHGWTIDPKQLTVALSVHTWVTDPVGGRTRYITPANVSRPDVGLAFAGAGDMHGFAVTVPVKLSGPYRVCSHAISTLPGASPTITDIGCKTAVVGPSRPAGSLDSASIGLVDSKPVLSLRGWAFDHALPSAVTNVHVYVTSPSGRTTSQAISASNSRPDIANAFVGAGSAHGFEASIGISEVGNYRVCVYAIGMGVFVDSHTALACGPVAFGPSAPTGVVDSASAVSGAINVTGWAFDNALRSAVTEAHIYVTAPNGSTRGYIALADGPRPDVGRVFSDAGSAHGYSINLPASVPGIYRVCTFPISAPQLGTGHIALPCKSVAVAG